MSDTNKSKVNSFILQGSILAMAGILVRVIGLIYRIPLNRILGKEGIGYYGTAYEVYNILILISCQSMPLAVSKIVAEKLKKEQYNNAHKVFKGALCYAIIVGVIFGSLAFFGSDFIATKLYDTPPIGRVIRVLAPTLTVACILGVLRGYFQGMGNMVPTAVSQIFEQIVNAIVSVIAAYELAAFGYTLAVYPDEKDILRSSYAAMGGTMGTLMGAIAALIVLLVILLKKRPQFVVLRNKDKSGVIDSYHKITKLLILTITPVLLSTTIYNIGNLLDGLIYQNVMSKIFKVPYTMRQRQYGVYTGYYRLLTTMPIAIASALSTAIVPSIVGSYTYKMWDEIEKKANLAIRSAMIIAFPCGVGLSLFGGQINTILFGAKAGNTSSIMMYSVFSVVFFSLSTITNAILQGIDKLNVPIRNSGIALVLHLFVIMFLLCVLKLDIYAVVLGDFIFGATVSLFNAISLRKYLGFKTDKVNTFLKPFLCSALMGAVAWAVFIMVRNAVGSIYTSTFAAILTAVVVYLPLLVTTKTVTKEQLKTFPFGGKLVRLFQKLKLMK